MSRADRCASVLAITTAAAAVGGWAHTAHHLRCKSRQLTRAERDHVTGLLTRAAWSRAAQTAWCQHDSVAGILDVDRFKEINDSCGHAAGDTVLRTLAARLVRHLGPASIAGRYGGDELVFITRRGLDLAPLQMELAGPVPVHDTELHIGVSVGLSAPGHTSPGKALDQADTAMYQAKPCQEARR